MKKKTPSKKETTNVQQPVVIKSGCVHPDDYYRKNQDGDEWCTLCGKEI